jgi:hypothetical protein
MLRHWSTGLLVLVTLTALGLLVMVQMSLWHMAETPATYRPLPTPWYNVSGIVFDGTSLWITVEGEQHIHRVEPDTGNITRTIAIPIQATGGSAWDGAFLWQLAYEEKRLYKIDLERGAIVATLSAPGQGRCSGMTYDGTFLWVANYEDKKLYQIDQHNGGKILHTLAADFETTGLAWDGKHLWSGILVGTVSHDEETPYTGFVQQRDLARQVTLKVLPLHGVGPGTSDWTPRRGETGRFWWYDGFHKQILAVQLHAGAAATTVRVCTVVLVLLTLLFASLTVRYLHIRRREEISLVTVDH